LAEEGVPVWVPPFWVVVELAGPWACRDQFYPKYAIRPVVRDGVRERVPLWLPEEEVVVVEPGWPGVPLWVLPVRVEGGEKGAVLLAWKARKRLE
jgi:hypothetical protein